MSSHVEPATVSDVVTAMDTITSGRILSKETGAHPWAISKDSGIDGKNIVEMPGLVWGDPKAPVRKLAVTMTMTEHVIELAAASGVDAIVAHHPVADGASAGGVLLRTYLDLYGLALVECHEALHGLHPGIPLLHGHQPYWGTTSFGGEHGMVVIVGRPLAEIATLGDVLDRIETMMDRPLERALNHGEAAARGCEALADSWITPGGRILVGARTDPIGAAVLHVFPHTGFGVAELDAVCADHPDVATVITSISAVRADSPFAHAVAARGLRLIAGNSHAAELLENGVPLAIALGALLRGVEVVLFRERVTALPLDAVGSPALRRLGTVMADRHLLSPSTNTAYQEGSSP